MPKESIQNPSIVFYLNPKFEIRNPKLSDHPVRPHQYIGRNRLTIFVCGAAFGFSILRLSSVQVLDFRLSEKESSHRIQILPFILFAP
jgi:hypothetical protein